MNDNIETTMENKDEIRVVVIGKKSAAKTSTFKTLVGEEKFHSKNRSPKCEAFTFRYENRSYLLFDTPGRLFK
jgi:hypothetical protein